MNRRALVLALGFAVGAASLTRGASPDLGSEAQKAAGEKLYTKYCAQCHGAKGDGEGYAAPHLRPAPRNFTTAKFKIRTTPSGALPTHDDLKNIIRRGMPGTSMPPWPDFTDEELSSLAYYVATFSPDFANPDLAPTPVPLPKAPPVAKDAVEAGRKVYETSGCVACHGSLGYGSGPSAPTLKDDWTHPIRPADLSHSWTFRGGSSREDIFRTFSTGVNGSPMPSFLDAIPAEQRWALTDYIDSISNHGAPGYATLLVAKHVDDTIDLTKGAAAFEGAPASRFPIVGQIMEPGRSFHPPTDSVVVQAIYDAQSVALLVRWHDMRADTTGHNAPNFPVPVEEEELPDGGAAAPAAGEGSTDIWGNATAPAAETKPADDVWGDSAGTTTTAVPASEFSDAVSVQIPTALPAGARKPYFIFGDAQGSVDVWHFDLARTEPRQYLGKGSADVALNDLGELSGTAKYDNGEWSVLFKRPLLSTAGVTFAQGGFVPVAFSVWDGFTRERGNRRGLTVWYHLYMQPEVVESPIGPMIRTALFVFALEVVAIFWARKRYGRKATEPIATDRMQRTTS